ncbi:16S rRNA (cytosine(967)-C(5))-methyltransferase RsmB [Cohnella sp. CFH 77786]|uniref:16S rRNA (cytosine(967)-C(5))-methyltransferase RsmB n=1 Tax=Cohnella sp. CFH 77786 TaxID=2662265 RepID=UPI001C60D339|nr:16S rRNA (cytosine(967)-C(5))-methyltransferase RsmB [Cohnella sp. CFH 77786]MBW5444670.1 16S rRNA (cytosine(967)-C(5))-methyltransferase RsmB [Cohnella sp. CFH 77786]
MAERQSKEAHPANANSAISDPAAKPAGENPAGAKTGRDPAAKPAGVNAAGAKAGRNPAAKPAGENAAGAKAGRNPAAKPPGENPAGENPAGARAGRNPAAKPPGGKSAAGDPQTRRGPAGPRELALEVLRRVEEQGAYSGLALHGMLTEAELSRADAALATELVYGTIQRLNTIDYVLSPRVKGWPRKVEPWVRCLLRLSYYQLHWLDRIPAHAAVDEAVRIAKKRGHAGIAGLVNGVLRGLLREGTAPVIPPDLPAAKRISLTHSHPLWLVERWMAAYGERIAEAICEAGNRPPHASVRVNRINTNRAAMLEEMAHAGLAVKPSPLSGDGILAEKAGNLADTPWFRDGRFTVQDESSMLVAAVADPKPGMTVLDCCAAPGGKSTHLAEIMGNRGKVIANDVHEHKRALIDRQRDRLGLTIIEATTSDALELDRACPPQSMDVVLLDAPCSGLGVIRRKPEIKWTKTPEDIAGLAALQLRLLGSASALVKPGGTLVYSTCTIAPEENEETVRRFLESHPDFAPDPAWPEEVLKPLQANGILPEPFEGRVQLLPHHFGSDGFFIARLRRR